MQKKISVIVVTRNEEKKLHSCLKALRAHFSDIWVVDSASTDKTRDIARSYGAHVVEFIWDRQGQRKYGWCLDHLEGLAEWVLFVDADEIMTDALAFEIKSMELKEAAYFIKSRYCVEGQILKHGLQNNKLSLLHRKKMKFPIVNDHDLELLGDIEGHYQPVRRAGYKGERIGQLKEYLIHDTQINGSEWDEKHKRYASWEAIMDKRRAWPRETSLKRIMLKFIFKRLPFRPHIAFMHSYIFKLGLLDGAVGYKLAKSRYNYYKLVKEARRDLKRQ